MEIIIYESKWVIEVNLREEKVSVANKTLIVHRIRWGKHLVQHM